MRNNYDLDELPNSLHSAQMPALLVMPVELDADRLFRERKDSLGTAAFSGGSKSVTYTVTHLLLTAPAEAGLGLRSHLPRLVDLIDSYTAALSADLTLGDQLLAPARVGVEPGLFPMASANSMAAPSATPGCWRFSDDDTIQHRHRPQS